MPLFALANAGIHVDGDAALEARSARRSRSASCSPTSSASRSASLGASWLGTRRGPLGGAARLAVTWPGLAGTGGGRRDRLHRLAADRRARLQRASCSTRPSSACSPPRSSRRSSAWIVFRLDRARCPRRCGRASSAAPPSSSIDLADDVDPERDHIRGAPGRAGDARRVRRLRVPLLRARRADRSASCSPSAATTCATSFVTCRSATSTPGRSWPPRRPRRPARRARSGRCTTSCSPTRASSTPRDLRRYAQELGLDVERFDEELRRRRYAARVGEDVASADASGVSGTPTFFINGRRHHGVYDVATLSAAVRAARSRVIPTPQPA